MKNSPQLNVKLLADAIGVCEKTIYRARWAGFDMPCGLATVDEYRTWKVSEARRKRAIRAEMSKNVQSAVMQ